MIKTNSINTLINNFESMQYKLVTSFGDIHNNKIYYQSVFNAISIAVYNSKDLTSEEYNHTEYLTNFCYKYFLNETLKIKNIKQLHLNIFPPKFKSSFLYENTNHDKKIPLIRGNYREIDTFIKFDGIEEDFSQNNNIAGEMAQLVYNYNKSEKKVYNLIYFLLESYKIHPFMDGNGKLFRILFDILLIKNSYYPSFFSKIYQKDKYNFRKYIHQYSSINRTKGYEGFLNLLLTEVYPKIYFSSYLNFDFNMEKR